jgi:hypothetical protein
MTKFIGIVLFLFCQNVVCQEYHFDTLLEYEYSTKKNPREGTLFFMINSKDNGYLYFRNSRTSSSEGFIIDFNAKTQNCYKLIDENKFEYLCTQQKIPLLFSEKKSNIKFQYNTVELNNDNSKILITKMKISKNGKMKIIDTISIEIEKNDFVFNYNLLKFFSEKYFDDKDLSFLGDKTPKSILFEYQYGFIRTFELSKIEKINTTLTINKEQIIYKK